MELDLTLNFFVLVVDRALRGLELEGLSEAAPGFRSILVSYDPQELPASELEASAAGEPRRAARLAGGAGGGDRRSERVLHRCGRE